MPLLIDPVKSTLAAMIRGLMLSPHLKPSTMLNQHAYCTLKVSSQLEPRALPPGGGRPICSVSRDSLWVAVTPNAPSALICQMQGFGCADGSVLPCTCWLACSRICCPYAQALFPLRRESSGHVDTCVSVDSSFIVSDLHPRKLPLQWCWFPPGRPRQVQRSPRRRKCTHTTVRTASLHWLCLNQALRTESIPSERLEECDGALLSCQSCHQHSSMLWTILLLQPCGLA